MGAARGWGLIFWSNSRGSSPPTSAERVLLPATGPKTGLQVAWPVESVNTLPGSAPVWPATGAQVAEAKVLGSGLTRRTDTLGTGVPPEEETKIWIGTVPVEPA